MWTYLGSVVLDGNRTAQAFTSLSTKLSWCPSPSPFEPSAETGTANPSQTSVGRWHIFCPNPFDRPWKAIWYNRKIWSKPRETADILSPSKAWQERYISYVAKGSKYATCTISWREGLEFTFKTDLARTDNAPVLAVSLRPYPRTPLFFKSKGKIGALPRSRNRPRCCRPLRQQENDTSPLEHVTHDTRLD